jgi:hypothetical protein
MTMIRSIIAAIVLALIAVHVAAGEDDLATQIRALQKVRLETLTDLVKIYALQYEMGAVSGEVFTGAETALVNAQLDAAGNPDSVKAILRAALERELNAANVAHRRALASKSLDRYYQTDHLLWSAVFDQTTIRLAQAKKDESVVAWKKKSRIDELTSVVENYKERYKIGTAPLEALVRAQADLLDARMNAAENRKERVALLEEHAKSEAELLKVAEGKSKASACSARLLFLDTKIRILRERGAKDDVAAQIKAAQKERIEALTELVRIDTELWKTGWTGLATLTQAKADLVNARVDAADTSEAKVLVLTEAAKEQADVVRITEARLGYMDTSADVDRERLRLLDFKIRLLRERSLFKLNPAAELEP